MTIPSPFELRLPSGVLRAHRFGADGERLTLCVHGLSASSRSFDVLGAALASPTRAVVAMDLRGRGWSEITPPGSYGWANHAVDIVAVADALAAPRFDYVGHSMGAYIGLELARLAPERIRKLVLIDAIGVPEAAAMVGIAASVRRLGTSYADADTYLAAMRALGHIEHWSEYWETYYRYELMPSPDGGVTPRTDRGAVLEDVGYASTRQPRSYWPAITMDSLLVRAARPLGAGFIVTAADRDQFLASVPGSSAVDIDGNHYGIVTHEATADNIRRFLS